MDLQISVFLLFILFTAGHSFSCYECSGLTDSCSDQNVKTCPSGFSKCMSETSVIKVGDIRDKWKVKDCAADCVSGSMNIGVVKTSSVCCNTERCNLLDAPDPSTLPNGKTCYTCDDKSCSSTVSCSGSEDRCFTATGTINGQPIVVKGCVSKSFCDAKTSVRSVETESASCCEGNLCNGANSVTQGANGVQSVTQGANGVQSVTQGANGVQSVIQCANGVQSIIQSANGVQSIIQCANGAQSVTQSFLFLCCSLLSFILLH